MLNWKVRFQNKVWLTAFLSFVVSTVFQFLGMFDIAAPVTQDMVLQIVAAALQLLSLLGIVVDPTTKGLSDSERAMAYEEPN